MIASEIYASWSEFRSKRKHPSRVPWSVIPEPVRIPFLRRQTVQGLGAVQSARQGALAGCVTENESCTFRGAGDSVAQVMTSHTNFSTRIQPHKRARSEAEIMEAAKGFTTDWVRGDQVGTWLYVHEGQGHELSRMIRRGWSWADISRALHAAGIHYATGHPIPARTLRTKASEARARARREADQPLSRSTRSLAQPMPAMSQPAKSDPRTVMVPAPDPEEHECEFQPVTMRDGHRPTKGDTRAAEPSIVPEVTPEFAQAVYERIFGKKPKD
jgi:hypothetical protein